MRVDIRKEDKWNVEFTNARDEGGFGMQEQEGRKVILQYTLAFKDLCLKLAL